MSVTFPPSPWILALGTQAHSLSVPKGIIEFCPGLFMPMALVIVKRLLGLASIPSFVYSASVHQLPTRSQDLPAGTACPALCHFLCLALSQLLLGVGWGEGT